MSCLRTYKTVNHKYPKDVKNLPMTQNIAFDSPCFLFGHPTVRDNSLPWLRDGPQRGQNHRDQHLTTEKHPQNCRIGCSWPLPRHQSSASSSLSSPASASSRTHDHAMLIPRTNASGTRDVAIDLVQETKDNLWTAATASAVLHTKRGIKSIFQKKHDHTRHMLHGMLDTSFAWSFVYTRIRFTVQF